MMMIWCLRALKQQGYIAPKTPGMDGLVGPLVTVASQVQSVEWDWQSGHVQSSFDRLWISNSPNYQELTKCMEGARACKKKLLSMGLESVNPSTRPVMKPNVHQTKPKSLLEVHQH